jgi:hypothetical protein
MSDDLVTGGLKTEAIDQIRRRLCSTAAMTIAAAQRRMIASAAAKTGKAASKSPAIKPGTKTSFKSVKLIDVGLLNVGYAEDGPSDDPPVVLLRGWPHHMHCYVDVAPLLASEEVRK